MCPVYNSMKIHAKEEHILFCGFTTDGFREMVEILLWRPMDYQTGFRGPDKVDTVDPPNTAALGTGKKAAVFGNRWWKVSWITKKTLLYLGLENAEC